MNGLDLSPLIVVLGLQVSIHACYPYTPRDLLIPMFLLHKWPTLFRLLTHSLKE